MKLNKEQHQAIELLFERITEQADNLSDVNDIILSVLQNDEI
jgi:hypothetical protein